MINVIGKRKIWYAFSGTLVVLSILSLLIWRLNFGIDFTGGSLMMIEFDGDEVPTVVEVADNLNAMDVGDVTVQPIDEKGFLLRFQDVTEEKHQEILQNLKDKYKAQTQESDQAGVDEEKEPAYTVTDESGKALDVELGTSADSKEIPDYPDVKQGVIERRFESIGPVIGSELKEKAVSSMLVVLIAIVIYIWWAFRKISWPVASWRYGVVAILTLFHDILILLGVFSVLGHFLSVEVNTAFVAALLTLLGYSVNDTIVVFDRIRENLVKQKGHFSDLINLSVNETFTRSINTSLTTLLVLLSIFLIGGESIRFFILALIVGVIVGTYSSIFIASPVLVTWFNKGRE